MNQNEAFYSFILSRISFFTSLFFILTIIFGTFYWSSFNKAIKIIFWYLCVRLLLNGLVALFSWSVKVHSKQFWKPFLGDSILLDLKNSHNNFSNGIYYLVFLVLPGLFFLQILKGHKHYFWFRYLYFFLIFFQIINYFFIDGFRSYGIVGATISDLFLIALPCLYFWQISNRPLNIVLIKNSYFWICLAFFLPHVVHLPISITATNLYESNFILYCKAHIIRNLIHIVSLFFYMIGFFNSRYLKYF